MPLVEYSNQSTELATGQFCGHPWCPRRVCNELSYIEIRIFYGVGRVMALPWQGRLLEEGFRFEDDAVLCHMANVPSTEFVYYWPMWGDTSVRWRPFATDQYFSWPYASALILKATNFPVENCIGFGRIARAFVEEITPYGLIGFGGLSSGEESSDDESVMDFDSDGDPMDVSDVESESGEGESERGDDEDENESDGKDGENEGEDGDSGDEESHDDTQNAKTAKNWDFIDLTLETTPPRRTQRQPLVIIGDIIDLTVSPDRA